MLSHSSNPRLPHRLALWLLLVMFVLSTRANAADQKHWELSPYRVQLHLAIDDAHSPQPNLSNQLATALQQQIRATLYPLWSTDIVLVTGAEKNRLLGRLDQLEHLPVEALPLGCDKQIFLNVLTTTLGVTLECREFDCSTGRWGTLQRRRLRQAWMLPSHCFDLICHTFSPLATIRLLPENDDEILLRFRGSDLPQQADLSFLTPPGEVFQPLRARTNSAGEVKAESIREIPWTYLTLSDPKEDGWHGTIHTGIRRPFGARRRGRIEHLAIALKNPTGTTSVRFHARHEPSQGLSGYEVFRREPSSTKSQPLGLTGADGAIEVVLGTSKVALLFLRSEGQLLAKLPVVPGAKPAIEVPVADDTARLRAQASLTSLTERLIDTVAQRNILIARVRDRLKSGQLDKAQELFTELDSLPGRARFNQEIKSVENRKQNHSRDPKVQARIEKLFADTRKLLGRFLSTKQITALQGELTAARR